jgi:PAS domain S-box-containing protein
MLESAFEQTPIPMVLASMPDGVLRIANSACQEYLGIMDEPALVGKPLADYKPSYLDYDNLGNLTPLNQAPLSLAMQGQKTLNQERRIVTKNGKTQWALVSGNPIYNAHGDIIAAYLVFPDITERKRTEEALRNSERRYRLLAENISDVVFTTDSKNRITFVTPSITNLVGFTPEEYAALSLQKRLLPHSYRLLTKHMDRLPYILELERPTKAGGTIWTEVKTSVFRDEEDREIGTIGVMRDIGERKRAEKLSRIYNHEQEVLAQASAALVSMKTTEEISNYLGPILRDETGADYLMITNHDPKSQCIRIVHLSGGPGFLRTWRRLTGNNPRNQLFPIQNVDKELINQLLNRRFNPMPEGIRSILKGVLPDNQVSLVEKTLEIDSAFLMGFVWHENLYGGVMLGYKKGRTFSNIKLAESMINLSAVAIQRRESEEALMESEKRFRTIFLTANEGVMLLDKHLRIATANQKMSEMLGYTFDEMQGLSPADFMPHDGVQIYRTQIHSRKKGLSGRYEQAYLRKDGSVIWFLISASPLLDDKGRFVGSFGMFTDITDRKRTEEDKVRLINELQGKNEELEAFTYTVSHDLKSPLVTVKGFLGMLQKDIASGNPDTIDKSIHFINDAVTKMESLLRDLLDLSRVGRTVQPYQSIPFGQLTRETAQLLSGIIRERGVKLSITRDRTLLHGDPVRMKQLLQNLLSNAIKFLGDQPEPEVKVGVRHEAGMPVFYVKDNGIGIAPRFHDKIFGLFDKLDPETDGTGVGLAICKRIIQLHNGRIWVESEGEGKGSTFCFTLPKKTMRKGRIRSNSNDCNQTNDVLGNEATKQIEH